MSLWNLFQKEKPDSKNAERERHQRLLTTGRIAEGRIIDVDGAGLDDIKQIFYVYNVNGADYESSDFLTADQRERMGEYAPGSKISVRYDPRQPANSVVV